MNNFTIISHNCWGAEVYRHLGLPYNTPFVGLFIPSPDYIYLLQHLKEILFLPMVFIDTTKYTEFAHLHTTKKYPIGTLGDRVEIHFLHYKDEGEALNKWNRRLSRINLAYDQLFIEFSDRDLNGQVELLSLFEILPYSNKVAFTSQFYPDLSSIVQIIEQKHDKQVSDGQALFTISQYYFDSISWVNGIDPNPSLFMRMKRSVRNLKRKLSL